MKKGELELMKFFMVNKASTLRKGERQFGSQSWFLQVGSEDIAPCRDCGMCHTVPFDI